jgi:hypothetical protein
MQKPTVLQTRDFPTPAAATAWLQSLSASYRRPDDQTGAPLYKAASGVVLRLAAPTRVEVLSNCVC